MREEIIKALNFRHACKEFDPAKKISEGDFKVILEAAHLSPSSFGLEPWKFLVVQNMELREKIRSVSWCAKKKLPTASHYIVTAALLSIDSCPIEGFVSRDAEKILAEDLGIDLSKYGKSCMLALGYRVNPPKPKARLQLDKTVQWFN